MSFFMPLFFFCCKGWFFLCGLFPLFFFFCRSPSLSIKLFFELIYNKFHHFPDFTSVLGHFFNKKKAALASIFFKIALFFRKGGFLVRPLVLIFFLQPLIRIHTYTLIYLPDISLDFLAIQTISWHYSGFSWHPSGFRWHYSGFAAIAVNFACSTLSFLCIPVAFPGIPVNFAGIVLYFFCFTVYFLAFQ